MSTPFDEAVMDAVMDGPAGEARLVLLLGTVTGHHRVAVAAALGDAQGEAGPAALRELLAAPQRSVDLRCAALLALAKREGAVASDVLDAFLTGGPAAVRDYALIALAGVGDDRSWDRVLGILRTTLDRPAPLVQPATLNAAVKQFEVLGIVAYLVRHLAADPKTRVASLAGVLRERFDRLYAVEQDWLAGNWPGIAPGGPVPGVPDPAPFRTWVASTRLFGPVH